MGDEQQRVPVPITRWRGKPTSGRFVYRSRGLTNGQYTWYWQCHLHDEDPVPDDQWGEAYLWSDTMANAIAHAAVCPFVAVRAGTAHDR